jgi:hypothetical protein
MHLSIVTDKTVLISPALPLKWLTDAYYCILKSGEKTSKIQVHMIYTYNILQEVYFEILTGVLSHTDCFPPDLVDSSAIPMTVSIIREGPW